MTQDGRGVPDTAPQAQQAQSVPPPQWAPGPQAPPGQPNPQVHPKGVPPPYYIPSPYPQPYAQSYPQPPSKPEPWGAEDPVLWGARRARSQALWGSAAVAALLITFGAGLYLVFTYFLYNGQPSGGERGPVGGFLLLVLSPLALSIVGMVAAWRLFRTCGAVRGRDGAPEGLGMASITLALSTLLWALLFPLFFGLLNIKSGKNGDFPLGLVGYLPAYMGLCVAVYISGTALMAWSKLTRVESGIALAIGWGALAVFLLFPAIINPARVTAGHYDLIVFWFRFGALMAALLPCLAVLGLLYAHGRWIAMVSMIGSIPAGAPPGPLPAGPLVPGSPCPACGGTLVTHPKTGATFCPACGHGLPQEQEVPWPPP